MVLPYVQHFRVKPFENVTERSPPSLPPDLVCFGCVLVLIPWTTTAGLALLACTMAATVVILVFVIGRLADNIVSGGFLIGVAAFWWSRRNR